MFISVMGPYTGFGNVMFMILRAVFGTDPFLFNVRSAETRLLFRIP